MESGQGRGKFFKKYLFINITQMTEKTIFRLYYLPCLLVFSLPCLVSTQMLKTYPCQEGVVTVPLVMQTFIKH